jgi:hypothetical protein
MNPLASEIPHLAFDIRRPPFAVRVGRFRAIRDAVFSAIPFRQFPKA